MLRNLKIKNLALVDDVQVGFNDGLNVITGETGAGKSLLIGALRLLLGERADKSMIRTGETSCSVYAEFGLEDTSHVDAILTDIGLEPCDGGLLIIRRMITESSNKTMVNDEPVTLQVLKRLGNVLVDMHGPYDHQSLLDTATQLEILDAFGQVDAAKKAYRSEYATFREIQKQINALNSENEEDLERQIEFLAYRVSEIEAAQLSEEEDEQVEEEHSVIANSQQVLELANGAVNALTEGEGCAFDGLASAQRSLNQLIKLMPEAQEWHDEIESAVTQVQEVVRAIENSAAGIDASPERIVVVGRLQNEIRDRVEDRAAEEDVDGRPIGFLVSDGDIVEPIPVDVSHRRGGRSVVVTGAGEIVDCNRGLTKNATGYDMRHLFIGSEGTLGLVVEAQMRLARTPTNQLVMVLGVPEFPDILKVLASFQARLTLSAFEFFSEIALTKVLEHRELQRPLADPAPLTELYAAPPPLPSWDELTEHTVTLYRDAREGGAQESRT